MNDTKKHLLRHALFLTGPTASGKSAVALELARQIGAEIIALDSMTLYRGMDIGTAKPTAEERARIPHHLIDVLDPWQSASVAQYREWAIESVESILARSVVPLFVGGTPLYLKALLRGLFKGPGADAQLRAELEQEAEASGNQALHKRLAAIDPQTAARVHPNDRRRIIRAIEVATLTGKPISAWQAEHEQPATGFRVYTISRQRSDLHNRIHNRLRAIFEQGFIDEVRALANLEPPLNQVPAQAVGYREVLQFLAGTIDQATCFNHALYRTRQYAKHQETWFRGLAEITPIPVEPDLPTQQIVARVRSQIILGSQPS